MRYLLIFSLLISFYACNSPTKEPEVVSKKDTNYRFLDEFHKYVIESSKDTSFPGVAVIIIKDSNVLYKKGIGLKHAGTTDSVDVHTVFRLASVSKGFASVLAGIFVQRGLIHWDDKVVKYLPDFRLHDLKYTQQLTIRHLLNQTTGLPRHTFTNMIESGVEYPKLRDKLVEVPLTAAPGVVHSYQNVAYSIIADILEKVSGKNFCTLLQEEIFIPLAMKDASCSLEALEESENKAIPHINTKRGFVPIKNTGEYYSVLPAAGVNASISDMENWLMALMGYFPKVLEPAMLNEIYTPSIETPRRRKYSFMRWLPLQRSFYALGWRVLIYNNDTLIYHGGGVKGFRAEIAFSRAHNLGIAIICNSSGKFINNAVPHFFDLYYKYGDEENKK